MKKLLLIIVLLFPLAASAQWTTHGFTIPAGHPRLWWNSSRLSAAQAWRTANPSASVFVSQQDAYGWQTVAWNHVVSGTDCSAAVTAVAAWAPPAGEVTTTAAGSDYMRWYAESAMLVYDWCYDQFSPGQKSTLIGHFNTWVGNVDQQPWGGLTMPDNNYFWGNLRNDLEWGIVSYGDNGSGPGSTADNFITDGLTNRWTNTFVPITLESTSGPTWGYTGDLGGIPHEGLGYGIVQGTYAMVPFQSAKLMGRDAFDESGYHEQMIWWIIYGTPTAETYNTYAAASYWEMFPYSDDELWTTGSEIPNRTYYQDYMNFASNYWSGTNAARYARQWYNNIGSAYTTDGFILAQDAKPAAADYTATLPLDYYAPGYQYLYGKNCWQANCTWFHWQMGAQNPEEGSHIHQDFGNFNIWRNGRWLSRETTEYAQDIPFYAGLGSPVDGSSIIAHNTIVFAPNPSLGGPGNPTYLVPSVTNGPPLVNRLESQNNYTYADVDLTNSYLWAADPAAVYNTGQAVHVEREFLFIRPLETTVILDRITTGAVIRGTPANTAAQVVTTFVLHSETNPTLNDANHLTITNGTQVLYASTLIPASATRRVINEATCSGCDATIGQYRVELDASGAAQRYFLNVLQGRDTGGSNLTATVVDSNPADPTSGTFTVTLTPSVGSVTTIVFNKGETSSGGTINVAASGATNLASGMESISYTDNGPIWGGPQPPTGVSGTAIPR
jgi:hypothetical protein